MRSILRPIQLLFVAFALFSAWLGLPRPALAGGSVSLTSREPTEVDGRWKLNMTIDYGSIPPIPHIPVIFSFTATMLYERALTDKSPEKPIVNRMPLVNQQSINESMDVGFSDASGKVFKVTKFDFIIKRDHGFEAGEYDLKIKREDDGVQIGPVIHLVLHGDNPVVDRRAIVFSGEGKVRKVKDDRPADDKGGGDDAKKDAPAEAKGDDAKSDDAKKDDPDAPAPPAVPPKQGGCGCVVAGDEAPGTAGVIALAALGAVVTLRRRRGRASSTIRVV
jgi:MYXO-CTERM domain-containing protein